MSTFFDSFILENTEKAQDINQSYYQYFETIKNSESIEDLSVHIGIANSNVTKSLIKKLKDRKIFMKFGNIVMGTTLKQKILYQ